MSYANFVNIGKNIPSNLEGWILKFMLILREYKLLINSISEGPNREKLAIAKIMLQGKESLDKIMKYTGLGKKELTMLL